MTIIFSVTNTSASSSIRFSYPKNQEGALRKGSEIFPPNVISNEEIWRLVTEPSSRANKTVEMEVFLISNFRPVLYVVCFLLGNSPASEFYMPTFRNTLSFPSS